MITQQGLPPHTMTCQQCGKTWDPAPARGKQGPTESSLQREAEHHFRTCEAR